jgi:hypothetical protein
MVTNRMQEKWGREEGEKEKEKCQLGSKHATYEFGLSDGPRDSDKKDQRKTGASSEIEEGFSSHGAEALGMSWVKRRPIINAGADG